MNALAAPSTWTLGAELTSLTVEPGALSSHRRFMAGGTHDPDEETDNICRVIGNTSSASVVYMSKTSDVRARLTSTVGNLITDLGTLKDVVHWQKRKLDYQAIYTAYLLGSLEEAEFLREADGFITEAKTLADDVLKVELSRLSRLLGDTLNPSDTAEFLQVELNQVLPLVSEGAHLLSKSPDARIDF